MKTASVIIRTKNEARSLAQTLSAVFAQELPPHEVFVIDSGSRDATLEIASRFPVLIRRIDPREWNYSRALNVCAREATGEFLVCLSAHCPPIRRDWLYKLLRHFDDPEVAAVWGPNLSPGRHEYAGGEPIRQRPGTYTVDTRMFGLVNSNSALRRSLWLEFPFDESLPATEDKAWGMEAMKRGFSIVHDPEAAVWHIRHPALESFKRNRAVMAGYAMLFPELARGR
ncbi:MAG TPA: glycosyltransferase family 2 protein, partial [Actinomycetota bacterium]|nr:glycosyltransferase family 2 protein [Actinomycetota bacterium]